MPLFPDVSSEKKKPSERTVFARRDYPLDSRRDSADFHEPRRFRELSSSPRYAFRLVWHALTPPVPPDSLISLPRFHRTPFYRDKRQDAEFLPA